MLFISVAMQTLEHSHRHIAALQWMVCEENSHLDFMKNHETAQDVSVILVYIQAER